MAATTVANATSSRAALDSNHSQLAASSNAQATAATTHRHRNNLILSPLDLSLRAGVNIVPITPPSTPSPPRKRARFMSDEHYLWRPHVMRTPTNTTATATNETAATTVANTTTIAEQAQHSYLHSMTYTRREELNSAYSLVNETGGYNHNTLTGTQSFINENN